MQIIDSEINSNMFFRYLYETFPSAEEKYVRIYDKECIFQEGRFLYGVAHFIGKTPAQIQKDLSLIFMPKYICDVVVKPPATLKTYRIAPKENPNTQDIEVIRIVASGELMYSNERSLDPNLPVQTKKDFLSPEAKL
ncbi:MAG: hypothetical protein WAO98_07965 [Alphaproteobacteria bacterium]